MLIVRSKIFEFWNDFTVASIEQILSMPIVVLHTHQEKMKFVYSPFRVVLFSVILVAFATAMKTINNWISYEIELRIDSINNSENYAWTSLWTLNLPKNGASLHNHMELHIAHHTSSTRCVIRMYLSTTVLFLHMSTHSHTLSASLIIYPQCLAVSTTLQ